MRGAILRFTEVHSRVLRDHTHLRTHASASLAQFTALVDGDLCAGLGVHVEDYSKWFLLDDVVVRYERKRKRKRKEEVRRDK